MATVERLPARRFVVLVIVIPDLHIPRSIDSNLYIDKIISDEFNVIKGLDEPIRPEPME
ncbi:hypothetical protein VSR82_21160 [Burkholderia sp. JPY481]|uniref:hypothetical protein n=1 Tax=Paraburkholderia sp. JPY465 TaxID=3042285 RepID=UPI0031773100